MKKILAVAIVAVMAVALCVSASANLNIDRIFVNANVMAEGTDVQANDPIEVDKGDKLYILGWAYGEASNLKEIVYSLDDGADVACPDNYRDRDDVAGVLGVDAALCKHGGFGHDTAEEGGLLELPGAAAKAGSFVLHIKAIYNDGTSEAKDFNLKVNDAVEEVKSDDQWLCGTEYDATKAPNWWFNPLCNAADDTEGRYITVNFKAAGYFNGIKAFCFCNPGSTGSTKVELIKDGSVVATSEIVSDGDKEYEVSFGKSFAAGTYSIKFSPLTGTGVEGENWFVLGGFAGTGEDVTVDTNVNFNGTDATQPCIMLIGSTPSGAASNPKTADAAVIAIAAVAVIALAGVVVAKKVK